MKSKQCFGKRGGNTIHSDIRLRLEAYFLANMADKSNKIPNEDIHASLLEDQEIGLIMPEVVIPEISTITNWMSRRFRSWKEDMQRQSRQTATHYMEVEEEDNLDSSDDSQKDVAMETQIQDDDVEELVSIDDSDNESGEESYTDQDSTDSE